MPRWTSRVQIPSPALGRPEKRRPFEHLKAGSVHGSPALPTRRRAEPGSRSAARVRVAAGDRGEGARGLDEASAGAQRPLGGGVDLAPIAQSRFDPGGTSRGASRGDEEGARRLEVKTRRSRHSAHLSTTRHYVFRVAKDGVHLRICVSDDERLQRSRLNIGLQVCSGPSARGLALRPLHGNGVPLPVG